MKINEIIREKRLEKGLTQKQVAEYLGVTAPAVNKWETGASYPEITLLPILARILGTDLNTLLSFQENLTEQEVSEIIRHITEVANEKSFEEAYAQAMKKAAEYPNSHILMLNIGLILEGILIMNGNLTSEYQKEQEEIERLYRRAMESSDERVGNQAKTMLISKYRERKEYDKAQELIDTFHDESPIDKRQVQARILMAQEKYEEAGKLTEQKLIKLISDLYGTLLTLVELAVKEKRLEDAKKIAEIYKRNAMQFEMWEFGWYSADIQLYSSLEDWDRFLETLELMLSSLKKECSPQKSGLFHYTDFSKQKEERGNKELGAKMQTMILNGLYRDEATAFLKDDPRLQEILERVGLLN